MFRKKSDDPWDRKPEKRPAVREAPSGDPADSEGPWTPPERKEEEGWNPGALLDGWLEKRRAADAEKAAPDLPPEKCPWCGRDMEQGYITGGRGYVRWYPGRLSTKAAWFGRSDAEGLAVLDENHFIPFKTVWLCRNCEKMVFDMPGPAQTGPFTEPEEKEESEKKPS